MKFVGAYKDTFLIDNASDDGLWSDHYKLTKSSESFRVTPSDALFLLQELGVSGGQDDRWQGIVALIRHDVEEGKEVRDFARRFAEGDRQKSEWLDDLPSPAVPAWQTRRQALEEGRDQERKAR